MSKVRVAGFGVSIDGFGAGPDQSLEHPLGKGGRDLHNWFYPTRTFRSMIGQDGGTDDRFAQAAAESSHLVFPLRSGHAEQRPNHRQRRLLRVHAQRPRGCRAAKCGQQFPPSDGD